MKLFLFVTGMLLLNGASAQVDKFSVPYKKPLSYRVPAPTTPALSHLGKLSHILPNGNKVYALPQDNMPCVVPGNGNSNKNMPNSVTIHVYPYKYKDQLGAIPNPAISNREEYKKMKK